MTLSDSKLTAVLLPGFGCDIDSMLELDHALNESQYIDRTQCEVFTSEATLDEMASKVVRQYSDSELLLVGFSMGGWIAQEVASRLRSQVKGLVLISSWTEAPSHYLEIIHNLNKELKSGKTLDSMRSIVAEGFTNTVTRDAMASRWVSMANRIGPEIFIRQTKAILEDPSVSQCVPEIQCPSLAIAGVADILLSPAEQFQWFVDQKIFQTITLDSCGHNLIWEQPQTVSKIIGQWLNAKFNSDDEYQHPYS